MLARALTLVAVLVAAAPAGARTTRAEDARERAHAHWTLGLGALRRRRSSPPRSTSSQAGYAAQPSPAFLVNIGQCLRKLDRLDEAALAFAASSTRTPARRARASTCGTRSRT